MKRHIRKHRGFTLMEILIAVAIMTIVVGGTLAAYLMSLTVWREEGIRVGLQREGGTAMEQMVRGVSGRDGIREAESINIPNSRTLQYTSGVDNQTRSFYLNNDEIMYDPDTSTSGNEYAIAEGVRIAPDGLDFAISGDMVTITLDMRDTLRGKDLNVNLITQVMIRN